MVRFKELTINDKHLFDAFFSKYPQQASEYTFTNLFIWRKSRLHEYALYQDHLIIKHIDGFYQPIGPTPWNIIRNLLEHFPNAKITRVEMGNIPLPTKTIPQSKNREDSSDQKVQEEKVLQSNKLSDESSKEIYILDNLEIMHQRAMHDYVYAVEELAKLEGTKFMEKRNFIKRCKTNHPLFRNLLPRDIDAIIDLANAWAKEKPHAREEIQALQELTQHYESLSIEGLGLFLEETMYGFIIGERLNQDTYVEHFEKANTTITGAYQCLLHELVKQLLGKYRWLNREQDLGIEGLRKAKLSWKPNHFVEKAIVQKA